MKARDVPFFARSDSFFSAKMRFIFAELWALNKAISVGVNGILVSESEHRRVMNTLQA
jgi:hypothetical protein